MEAATITKKLLAAEGKMNISNNKSFSLQSRQSRTSMRTTFSELNEVRKILRKASCQRPSRMLDLQPNTTTQWPVLQLQTWTTTTSCVTLSNLLSMDLMKSTFKLCQNHQSHMLYNKTTKMSELPWLASHSSHSAQTSNSHSNQECPGRLRTNLTSFMLSQKCSWTAWARPRRIPSETMCSEPAITSKKMSLTLVLASFVNEWFKNN